MSVSVKRTVHSPPHFSHSPCPIHPLYIVCSYNLDHTHLLHLLFPERVWCSAAGAGKKKAGVWKWNSQISDQPQGSCCLIMRNSSSNLKLRNSKVASLTKKTRTLLKMRLMSQVGLLRLRWAVGCVIGLTAAELPGDVLAAAWGPRWSPLRMSCLLSLPPDSIVSRAAGRVLLLLFHSKAFCSGRWECYLRRVWPAAAEAWGRSRWEVRSSAADVWQVGPGGPMWCVLFGDREQQWKLLLFSTSIWDVQLDCIASIWVSLHL